MGLCPQGLARNELVRVTNFILSENIPYDFHIETSFQVIQELHLGDVLLS